MTDEVIEKLTELLIKENFKNQDKIQEKYIITKEDLIRFCIKMMKLIGRIENDEL